MGGVSLNFDEDRNLLIAKGEIDKTIRLPLVRRLILRHRGSMGQDGVLTIPCPQENLESLTRSFRKALATYNIEFAFGDELSGAMEEVERREVRFEEFSTKAAAIWQGKFDPNEFSEFVSLVERACPGRKFYNRQLLSAYHLAFSQNACNFSVPGAGKTSVVYAAYSYLNSLSPEHEKFVDHILVVGPLSSFKAWEDEFKIIFGRAPSCQRLSGGFEASERKAYLRGYALNSERTELTLTHYQTLSSSEDQFMAFLQASSRRVMMVLDEAHKIKRSDGIWATSALQLAQFANSRVVLTGTPAPNGYEDLRNLFSFIYPERDVIGFHGTALAAMTDGKMDGALEKMKGMIKPFYTRVRKQDFDPPLPAIEEQTIEVELGEIHREIYSRIEKSIVPNFGQQPDSVSEFLTRARLMRLRQAATNPSLLLRPIEEEFGTRPAVDPLGKIDRELRGMIESFNAQEDLAKLDVLIKLVRNLQNEHPKILIWSIFIQNLELIEGSMGDMADWVRMISGRTPVGGDEMLPEDEDIETREKLIDEFLSIEGNAIMIANPQAVGESISLHHDCHVAIYFDLDFNAGLFIQSKDRIHRYGLAPDTLTSYYYLTTQKSVEEDIYARLLWKENRLSELIDKDDIPLFSAVLGDDEDKEDIRAIIASYERRKS